MKNLSNVDIHEFLSRCDSGHVEGRTFEYEGKVYGIPYSTVTINNVKIPGLRENESRLELIEKIIDEHSTKRKSYLDIGSNLGVFVKYFQDKFDTVAGIEADSYYFDQARFLFPELKDRFILNNINSIKLSDMNIGSIDVITAMSMIEYIDDKQSFVNDLYHISNDLVIIEGHSEDVKKGHDKVYEMILRSCDWNVLRINETTDVGINAPSDTIKDGRPVWICKK